MQPLVWNLARFNHIFSYPSDAGDGAETHAQDMVNLRVDRWGHLRLRPVIRALQMHEAGDIAQEDLAITGVAASARTLYWLRSDGKLFLADNNPANPFQIRNVSNLRDRLSLVSRIGDDNLVIITSEGNDHGYVIHASVAEPLGLDSPQEDDFEISLGSGSVALDDDYTFYRLTYSGKGILGELESGSFKHAVKLRQNLGVGNQQDLIDSGSYYVEFELQEKPADNRITHLNIYRSSQRHAAENTPDSQIVYHRIHQLEIAGNAGNYPQDFRDRTLKTTVDKAHKYEDNSTLPTNAGQIALFNDRLFAPNGDELRFSDVRNAIPAWHAWPVINSVKHGGRIDFCAEYRGILLFGAADGLYRLSGTSRQTYRYDQISSRGPVSRHAWGVLENAFGFVGSDGLYLTDGTKAPEIAPQLKGYFNRYEVEDGFVGMLPNKASLWGVNRRNKSTNQTDIVYFVNEGNDWVRITEGSSEWIASAIVNPSSDRTVSATEIPDASHIRQYTSVKFDGLPLTGVIADGQRAPRLIDWVVDDETVDGLTEYSGQDAPPTEDIAWMWESQQLDWNSQGLGSEMKTFKELVIDGKAENDITATFYIDGQEPAEKTISAMRTGGERFDYRRVRIDRRGFALRFKIAGTGGVMIRGLKVRAYV